MALKRTQDTPWRVVNLMTNETVGYYETEIAALLAHRGEPIDVIYNPMNKRKAGRKFP